VPSFGEGEGWRIQCLDGPRGLVFKRVYEPPEASDGMRVLVDRIWPRGLTKEHASVDV
jgi:hypothetical protein